MLRFVTVSVSALLVLSVCLADAAFDKTVKNTTDFPGIQTIAQNEKDSSGEYLKNQGKLYQESVAENRKKFDTLKKHYDSYLSKAGFSCFLYKIDYRWTRSSFDKAIQTEEKQNIPEELNNKFIKERKQLVENIQTIGNLTKQADEDSSKTKTNIKKAQEILIDGHSKFYDRIDEYMVWKHDGLEKGMDMKRANLVLKGDRVKKCSL